MKPAQSTAFTPDGLVVTPETAKVRDANGNPVLDKDGREVVDPTKVVSFGSPTIAVDPKTGKPMVDPKNWRTSDEIWHLCRWSSDGECGTRCS